MANFVYERPELEATRKRRSRAAIACDSCRIKKSRCVVSPEEKICQACRQAATHCSFENRGLNSTEGDRAVTDDSPEFESTALPVITLEAPNFASNNTGALSFLFGTVDPDAPHPTLMSHYIETFFRQYAGVFRFLSYEQAVSEYLQSTLSPIMANIMAALAVPLCANAVQFQAIDTQLASTVYIRKAIKLLGSDDQTPSVLRLQALVMVSRIVHRGGKLDAYRMFAQRAYMMTNALGTADETKIGLLVQGADERQRLRFLHKDATTPLLC